MPMCEDPPYTLHFDAQKDIYVCRVDNTEFLFRKKPYDTQVALVKAMRSCFENNEIGVLESPTGTGKSMSIVSSVLSWLRDIHRGRVQINQKSIPLVHTAPSFVQKWKGSNSLSRLKEQILLKRRGKRLLAEKDNSISTDYDHKSFAGQEHFIGRVPESPSTEYVLPKIILASRTHSQLNQLAQEFKSTFCHIEPCDGLSPILLLPLASRMQTCLNHHVLEKSKADSTSLNDLCISIGRECSYHEESKISELVKSIERSDSKVSRLNRSYTLSDIEEMGRICNACPYYATRAAVSRASIILTPYSLILDESMRQDLDIELEGCVVILDEAHNIISSGQSALSQTISLAQLKSLLPFLSLMHHSAKVSGVKLQWAELLNIIEKLQDAIDYMHTCFIKSINQNQSDAKSLSDQTVKKEIVFTVNKFLSKCNSSDHNFFRICAFIQQQARCSKSWPDNHRATFSSLQRFFIRIAKNTGDTVVFINISDALVKVSGLRAGRALSSIFNKSLAVIMLGGTMQSQDILDSEIFVTSPQRTLGLPRKISRITFPHVVSPQNVLVDCWPQSPSGIRFRFTHCQHMENIDRNFKSSMIGGLAQIITNLGNFVPGGVVFFFSSYNYLNFVKATFTINNFFDSLKSKQVEYFFEEKMQDTEKLLRDYKRTVEISEKSVFLFAVLGGKLSEGINFSDKYGRVVCIAGLPYPNPFDVENETRMRFALSGEIRNDNETFGAIESSRQSAYYDALCMAVVNQAIGRVIRHKDDYAAIIFLDERMRESRLQNLLPKWVLNSFRKCTSDYDSVSGIRHLRYFFDLQCKIRN